MSRIVEGGPSAPSAIADAYPFGAHSVWRLDVSTAPVEPGSDHKVKYLAGTVSDRYGGVAAFNAHSYNTTYYFASADTARTNVAFDDCQSKGYTPEGLFGPGGQFTSVPIPADARPAQGTDGEMTIYSPSTDQLWEFWNMKRTSSGWAACWGGRMDDVSTGPGYFKGGFGATATGLPNAAGMVSLADVRAGVIGHALSLQIPNPANFTAVSWPAQRSDGWDKSPSAVAEGTRLRLDPSIDVDSLHLTKVGRMIAIAAQKYGFIVSDKSGSVAVVAEDGRGRDAANPDPWARINTTPDYAVLKGFPWQRLQVLPKDYLKG